MAYRDDGDLHDRKLSMEQSRGQNQEPAATALDEHSHGHLHRDPHVELDQKKEIGEHNSPTNQNSPASYDQAQPDDTKKHSSRVIGGEIQDLGHVTSDADPKGHSLSSFYVKYRIFFHLIIWLFFTG